MVMLLMRSGDIFSGYIRKYIGIVKMYNLEPISREVSGKDQINLQRLPNATHRRPKMRIDTAPSLTVENKVS